MLAVTFADSLCTEWADKQLVLVTNSWSALSAPLVPALSAGFLVVKLHFLPDCSCTFCRELFFFGGSQSRHAQGLNPAKKSPSRFFIGNQQTAYFAHALFAPWLRVR